MDWFESPPRRARQQQTELPEPALSAGRGTAYARDSEHAHDFDHAREAGYARDFESYDAFDPREAFGLGDDFERRHDSREPHVDLRRGAARRLARMRHAAEHGTVAEAPAADAPRVVAEFDWASADARAIEDRIWGLNPAGELDAVDELQALAGREPEVTAAPLPDAGTDADEETFWGPRPRLAAETSGGRRTVVITGRAADRYVSPVRVHQPSSQLYARWASLGRADRMAMWAVALGLILVLVAIASGH